jgi:hypothetical protein
MLWGLHIDGNRNWLFYLECRVPQHIMGALEQGPAKVEEDQDEQDGMNEQKR